MDDNPVTMSSPLIQVTAKTLAGDLFVLSIDPAMGLDAIRTALSTMDPLMFPLRRTIVQRMDDDEATTLLVDGCIVLILVEPEVRCRLEAVTDEQITPPDGAPIPIRHWSFTLESGEPFHVYRKVHPVCGLIRYHACTEAIRPDDPDRERTYTRALEDSFVPHLSSNSRDWYVVKTVIHRMEETFKKETMEEDEIQPRFRSRYTVCTCGVVLSTLSMKSHLKSRSHLAEGDPTFGEFMKRVDDDLTAFSV